MDGSNEHYTEKLKVELGEYFNPVPSESEVAHFRQDLDVAEEVGQLYGALTKMIANDHAGARASLDALGFNRNMQREIALHNLEWVSNNADYQDWYRELDRDIYMMSNPYYHLVRRVEGNGKVRSQSKPNDKLSEAVIGQLTPQEQQEFIELLKKRERR